MRSGVVFQFQRLVNVCNRLFYEKLILVPGLQDANQNCVNCCFVLKCSCLIGPICMDMLCEVICWIVICCAGLNNTPCNPHELQGVFDCSLLEFTVRWRSQKAYFAVVSISPIMRRIEALRAAVSTGAGRTAVESVSTSINPRPAINGLISGSWPRNFL